MRKGSIITLALSLVIAGSGCAILSQVMAKEQKQTVVKTVRNEKNTISDYQKDMGKDENAIDEMGKTANTDYPIYKDENDKVKKTEADMEMEDAVKIAVKKVEEIYGKIDVTEVVHVFLSGISAVGDNGKSYECRAYFGTIKTNKNVCYKFGVNSITKEVVDIGKIWKFDDPVMCSDDDTLVESLDKDIKQNSDKYSNIAKKFVNKYLKRGKVKKIYSVMGGGISNSTIENCKLHLATVVVSCETEDGSNYNIDIYPATKEVVSYSLFYAPN